jgi:hypothetical protein
LVFDQLAGVVRAWTSPGSRTSFDRSLQLLSCVFLCYLYLMMRRNGGGSRNGHVCRALAGTGYARVSPAGLLCVYMIKVGQLLIDCSVSCVNEYLALGV